MDSLIKFNGKPLEKLFDVISNGIGTLYRPRSIRKEADAKAYEIIAIEKAKKIAEGEGRLIEADYLDRMNERIVAKEMNRQKNIDDIVEEAGRILENENEISEAPVEPDWTVRFFDIIQDVSDMEMKSLWSRILAGEVKTPNSYSKRTLELLRNLSKEEATLFVKIAQYVLQHGDFFIFRGINDNLEKFGISYSDIAKLTEIGLIQSGSFVNMNFNNPKKIKREVGISYGGLILLLKMEDTIDKVSIPVYCLTTAGIELYKLIDVKPNIDYIRELNKEIKKEGVSLEYSKIKSGNLGEGISYFLPTHKLD